MVESGHNGPVDEVAGLVRAEWASYIEPLLPIAEELSVLLSDPKDPQLRHEFYRGLITEMSTGYLGVMYADPRHPDPYPFTNNAFNCYLNNPDDVYYLTPIDDDGVYRIAGFRGTVRRIDFQVGYGGFMTTGVVDEHRYGKVHANYDLDEHVTLGRDGSFEVILSRRRPDGWDGDWWELHEGARNIFIRQISYDWVNEVDGRFGIDRLDVPAAKPRQTLDELRTRLAAYSRWVEGSMRCSLDFLKWTRGNIGVNVLGYLDLGEHSAIATQGYVYGGFDLEPDEALLIEFEVPRRCRYWSYHLGDDVGFMVDWLHHQSVLNGHSAVVDPDGHCRIVVSAQDPGVSNWLDTTGYQTGVIAGRWELCDFFPEHQVRKVKTDQVRALLPTDTTMVTPRQRDASIRERRLGQQMRKRW